jgi:hypothetical protein
MSSVRNMSLQELLTETFFSLPILSHAQRQIAESLIEP